MTIQSSQAAASIESICDAARERVAMHRPIAELAPDTQRTINKVHAVLLRHAAGTGEPLNVVLETRTSRSAFMLGRYCLRRFETEALAEVLKRVGLRDDSQAMPGGDVVQQIEISLTRLRKADEARPPVHTKRRTRASRLALHPADWQRQLIAGSPGRLRIALLIMHLTGCRPCEIERGVSFQIGRQHSDVRLTLKVIGAKCDQYRGQPFRILQFLEEETRLEVGYLIDALMRYQDTSTSPMFRLKNVTQRVYWQSRKLWPCHEVRPTAYSFRYAFRHHLALLGATRQEIARAMGHQSTLSSLSYGGQKARERTLDLSMEISAPIEPRSPSRQLEYTERLEHRGSATRLAAHDISQDFYPAMRL